MTTPSPERDYLQARIDAAERTIGVYAKDVTALRQEFDEARRSAESLATAARNFRDAFDSRTPPTAAQSTGDAADREAVDVAGSTVAGRTPPSPVHYAQPTTDDVERARESKEDTHQRYYLAFHDWFMSEDSSCDFWSECNAPENLATIAVEIHDAALTAARREEREPMAVIGKLQELVVNVRYLVAHGCSETAIKGLDEAMADGWAATGYKDLLARDAERTTGLPL